MDTPPSLGRFQRGDGIFQQRTRLSPAGSATPDDFFAALLFFFQPDEVQQFIVKAFVQGVAVVGEGVFEQVRRREDFEEGDELFVVRFIFVAQRLFKVLDVEMRSADLHLQLRQERAGNVLVKEGGIILGFPAAFPVFILFQQRPVLVKQPVKRRSVEHVPVIDIGDGEVLAVRVVLLDPLFQVIQYQFMHRLGVGIRCGNHVAFVLRSFYLEQHGGFTLRRVVIVDDKVGFSFGVEQVEVFVPGLVEEVPEVVFGVFLAFLVVNAVEQPGEVGFESLDVSPVGLHLLVGFVQRLFEWDERKLHGEGNLEMKGEK